MIKMEAAARRVAAFFVVCYGCLCLVLLRLAVMWMSNL
jgi:hypothetical protein